MIGGRLQIFLASPQLKEIEHLPLEQLCRSASAERTEVRSTRRQPRGDLRARKCIRGHELHVSGHPKLQEFHIVAGQPPPCDFIQNQGRLETRGRGPVLDAFDRFAEAANAKQAFQPPPERRRAADVRLTAAPKNGEDGGSRGNRVLVVNGGDARLRSEHRGAVPQSQSRGSRARVPPGSCPPAQH
jgi:hypothetical protein